MISTWLRVIRVRFLLASVVAVSAGLAITWWQIGNITLFDAVLTMAGVLCLHASVDLLNDYWDFKRGIDTTTQRTITKTCTSLCGRYYLFDNWSFHRHLFCYD